MSIRTLTNCLKEEATEARRRRNFSSVTKRSSYGSSENRISTKLQDLVLPKVKPKENFGRNPVQPEDVLLLENVRTPIIPKVGIRPRKEQNHWGIPGGIAERFVLQDRIEELDQPTQETISKSEKEPETPITIELKLH